MTENRTYGLTEEEAARRLENGEGNTADDSSQKTIGSIIRENVCTYFNLIFLILAILLVVSGNAHSLTFLPVIIANTLIGIAQEIYAKKVLDGLSIANAPTAEVIRDGRERTIEVGKLVRGDVIRLRGGMQIPADASVVDGTLSVNESLLTGESDEIEKQAGEELMSGSFVVSGDARAELTRVGDDSYISKLTKKARQISDGEQSEMVRSIDRLVRVMGILLIPIGTALFVQSIVQRGASFHDSVNSMVAAVIGMIPEGLYLLVSVTLAMSAARLALRHVMLHDMKSIESLARVDVLCVDKTGTITDTAMLVAGCALPGEDPDSVFPPAGPEVLSAACDEDADIARNRKLERGSKKAGPRTAGRTDAGTLPEEMRTWMGSYLSSLSDNNISMEALRKYFSANNAHHAREALPFTSRNKYSAVRFQDRTLVLGAPEILLGQDIGRYAHEIDAYAGRGLRVMLFGQLGEGSVPLPADGIGSAHVKPLFFILLQNPIRKNAPKTFAYFRKQGVDIRVISGDNPRTAAEAARQAGIPGADRIVDARTLATKGDILEAVRTKKVFGRVTPEQKRLIVRALQHDGHTVAMTGDGVNDILAMKDADCSIAMASGSDAAVQSAQVALLDSEFSHMPEIVGEGRRVINNIERSATLFLVKNIFSVLLAVFSIISVVSYPLTPSQISLISAFNIGIPAFFLAMEPNHRRSEKHFMRRVLIRALPAALTDFFSIAALVVFGETFGVSASDISVASTFLLGIVGFIILYNISAPLNGYRIAVIAGCIGGLIFTAYFFNGLFDVGVVSVKCAMLFVLFAIATEPCMRYLTKLSEWILRKAEKRTAER